jgi:hypothetical protein
MDQFTVANSVCTNVAHVRATLTPQRPSNHGEETLLQRRPIDASIIETN